MNPQLKAMSQPPYNTNTQTTPVVSSGNHQQVHPTEEVRPVKKYKVWEVLPGRNKFCCDGRLMMATSTGLFVLLKLFIAVMPLTQTLTIIDFFLQIQVNSENIFVINFG